MKNITKLLITLTLFTLLLGMTACTGANTNINIEQNEKESKTYTLSGSIAFESAALPGDFLMPRASVSRSAISSYSTLSETFEYLISATNGTDTVSGDINSNHPVTFSMELPAEGDWTITAKLCKNTQILCTGNASVSIDENTDSEELQDIRIQLRTPESSAQNFKGGINLTIQSQSTEVNSIVWQWLKEESETQELNDVTKEFADGESAVRFEFSSINPKNYDVLLSFYDSNNKLLYSCCESINVFPGWITDTWNGSSPYITEQNGFVYTDAIGTTFPRNINRIEIPEGSTIYALWSSPNFESDPAGGFITEYNTIDSSITPAQNQKGVQLFTSLEEGMTITNPLPEKIGPGFCMDGDIIYAPPYRYIKSYAGYVKDSGFDLTRIGTPADGWTSTGFLDKCLIVDRILYYVQIFSDGWDTRYYISRYNLDNHNCARERGTVGLCDSIITSFEVMHEKNSDGTVNTDKGVFYIHYYDTYSSNQPTLCRKPFRIQPNDQNVEYFDIYLPYDSDPLLESGDIMPSTIPLSFLCGDAGLFFNPAVSDMKIVGDKLYVLLYESSADYVLFSEDNGSFIPAYNRTVCNGGILKFDITSAAADSDDFFPLDWDTINSENTYKMVLGLYIEPFPDDGKTYYSDSWGETQIEPTVSNSIGETIPVLLPTQPPLTAEGKANADYFYGPRKILVASENELVIVDDSGYIQNPAKVDKNGMIVVEAQKMPINRVVTVDLQQEKITSTVDVGATFSASFQLPSSMPMTIGSGNCFATCDQY